MNDLTSNHGTEINNLSLFANLNKNEIEKILQNSYIHHYQKGETLFLKDQKIANFYIVLKGSVKLLIVNEEGQEAVVQIVNEGKYLTDISGKVFLNSAEALEDVIILAIGLENFRQQLKDNHSLALNMLLDMSSQNRVLTNQISTLKLADAKHKVGQFLLETAFEKGDRTNNINLKTEKSDIASYLGMKPETLSRNLKKLKDDGEIVIEKNQIILTREESLCEYCNSEISATCNRHKFDC